LTIRPLDLRQLRTDPLGKSSCDWSISINIAAIAASFDADAGPLRLTSRPLQLRWTASSERIWCGHEGNPQSLAATWCRTQASGPNPGKIGDFV